LPDANTIDAPSRQELAVRVEGKAKTVACASLEGKSLLSGGWVPDAHGTVFAGRGQAAEVGKESHCQNGFGVTFQRANFPALGNVPELDGVIVTAAGQEQLSFSIAAERHAGDALGVLGEGGHHLAGGRIPQDDRFVFAGRCQPPSVGTYCKAIDRLGMAAKSAF